MRYKISGNVIRRLPRYLRWLKLLERQKVEKVSSSSLGERMGLTASQIRQDFNCFGGFGQQGYGYNVHELKNDIGAILGLDSSLTAVVVGAGNLGRALMANFQFNDCGVALSAAFDKAPELIGTAVNGVEILDADGLEGYLKAHHVDVVILTLPRRYADSVAKMASDNGVGGIWNFTGIDIGADLGDTVVEDVHLSDSLLTLGYYLRSRQNSKEDV